MICPNCGKQISGGVSFCPNCAGRIEDTTQKSGGANFEAENANLKRKAEEATAEIKKLKKQIKIIAIVLAILACAAVAFVVIKNVMSNDANSSPEAEVSSLTNVSVGDYIEFGTYEQDNNTSNGKEPIEWRVLEVEGDRALLISEYALDCLEYNEEYDDITWEDCTLREWLNSEFIGKAFSSSEQKKIRVTTVTAEDNPEYGTEAGNDTEDKVFLLSIAEAKKYFDSNDDRICKPTEHAAERGAYINDDYGSCWWWLRSPGSNQTYAASVITDGYVGVIGLGGDADYFEIGVRPALWVNLNS